MKKIIGALIASSLMLEAAHATPVITLTGEYSGHQYSQAPVIVPVDAGQANLDVSNLELYQDNSALGMADNAGNFGLKAYTFWEGSTTTSYSYSDTINNSGSVANTYTYNFFVPSVTLYTKSYNSWAGPSVNTASYDYRILVNDLSVFHSTATVSVDDLGVRNDTLNSDLFGINLATGKSDPYSGLANLGALDPGQSLSFKIIVSLTASRDVTPSCGSALSDCAGGATATFGDPSNIASQPTGFNIVAAQVTSVPLPDSLVLLISGGLFLFCTRPTKRQQGSTVAF